MKEINKSWVNFKAKVTERSLRPQFDYFTDYIENNGAHSQISKINIYGLDGFILFITTLVDGTSDYTDFETNFKSDWNKQLDFTDPSGIHQFIPSARPAGTITFFTGKGDNDVSLDFNLTANDASISRDLTFAEDIYIKDGALFFENAPFGASFTVEAVHPQVGVVMRFCRNVLILGTGQFQLNSEDKSQLQLGLILRVTINNAPTPTAFKAVCSLEGFRTNTLL